MNALRSLTGIELWQLAGWTMVHFLWLGALVAAAAATCRLLLRRAQPNIRYAFMLAWLAALAALPLIAAAWLYSNSPRLNGGAGGWIPIAATTSPAPTALQSPAPIIELHQPELDETAAASPSAYALPSPPLASSANSNLLPQTSSPLNPPQPAPAATAPIPWPSSLDARPSTIATLTAIIPYLPWFWLIGTPVTFALLITGVVGTRRLNRASQPITAGPIPALLSQLTESLRITRRVTVAICDRIAAPVLIGIIRPMILLPPAALTGWSPDEIEMVLLHELAHVRRWDNLMNLLQRVVESLLFFHPAVWIVSSWVRSDRESCCDALVVRRTNRPHAYAEMLVALAAQIPRSVLFHPAASSAMAAGPLRSRIRRILQLEDDPMLVSGKSLTLVFGALAVAATLGVLYVPTIGEAKEKQAKSTKTAAENEADAIFGGSEESSDRPLRSPFAPESPSDAKSTGDSTPQPVRIPFKFVLKRDKSGRTRLYMNDQPVGDDVVRTVIGEQGKFVGKLQVSLSAEKGINPAEVKRVLDLLDSLGVKKISIDAPDAKDTDDLPPIPPTNDMLAEALSKNNLRALSMATQMYINKHKTLPPHAIYSADGKPLLSWRVAILPYLGTEEQALYKQFHLDEPWNSEHNRKLVARIPILFVIPKVGLPPVYAGKTNYLAAVGRDCVFDGTAKGREFKDVTDGTSNTIAFVEANVDQAVEWTKPADWEFDADQPAHGLGTVWTGHWNAAFVDAHVRDIANTEPADVVAAQFTRAGGEVKELKKSDEGSQPSFGTPPGGFPGELIPGAAPPVEDPFSTQAPPPGLEPPAASAPAGSAPIFLREPAAPSTGAGLPADPHAPATESGALPAGAPRTAAYASEPLLFRLKMNADGSLTLYLNGNKISVDEVKSKLPQSQAELDACTVSLSADKGIAYSNVMTVVEMFQSLGITKMALDTRAPEAGYANPSGSAASRTNGTASSGDRYSPGGVPTTDAITIGPNRPADQSRYSPPGMPSDGSATGMEMGRKGRSELEARPTGDWPAGVVFPSPKEGNIAAEAWHRLKIKVLPATKQEQADENTSGLKVIAGIDPPRGLNKPVFLLAINAHLARTFDELAGALAASKNEKLIVAKCVTNAPFGPIWIDTALDPSGDPRRSIRQERAGVSSTLTATTAIPAAAGMATSGAAPTELSVVTTTAEAVPSVAAGVPSKTVFATFPADGLSSKTREVLNAIENAEQLKLDVEFESRPNEFVLVTTPIPTEKDWPGVLGEPPRKDREIAVKAWLRLGLKLVPMTRSELTLRQELGLATGVRIIGGNIPKGLPLPALLTSVGGTNIDNFNGLLSYVEGDQGDSALRCYATADGKDYMFDASPPEKPAAPVAPPTAGSMPRPLLGPVTSLAPTVASPEELKVLRERVTIIEEQYLANESLYKKGQKGGSLDRVKSAGYELALAEGELALAAGRPDLAVEKFQKARTNAEEALTAIQDAYRSNKITHDVLLQAIRNVSDIKLKLIHLQARPATTSESQVAPAFSPPPPAAQMQTGQSLPVDPSAISGVDIVTTERMVDGRKVYEQQMVPRTASPQPPHESGWGSNPNALRQSQPATSNAPSLQSGGIYLAPPGIQPPLTHSGPTSAQATRPGASPPLGTTTRNAPSEDPYAAPPAATSNDRADLAPIQNPTAVAPPPRTPSPADQPPSSPLGQRPPEPNVADAPPSSWPQVAAIAPTAAEQSPSSTPTPSLANAESSAPKASTEQSLFLQLVYDKDSIEQSKLLEQFQKGIAPRLAARYRIGIGSVASPVNVGSTLPNGQKLESLPTYFLLHNDKVERALKGPQTFAQLSSVIREVTAEANATSKAPNATPTEAPPGHEFRARTIPSGETVIESFPVGQPSTAPVIAENPPAPTPPAAALEPTPATPNPTPLAQSPESSTKRSYTLQFIYARDNVEQSKLAEEFQNVAAPKLREKYPVRIDVLRLPNNSEFELPNGFKVNSLPIYVLYHKGEVGGILKGSTSFANLDSQLAAATAGSNATKNAPAPADKSNLRYDGKTFDDWRSVWQTELSTEKRLEAIKALAAFGRAGYGKEATETILDVASEYDFAILEGKEAPEGALKETVLEALTPQYRPAKLAEFWVPEITARAKKDPKKWHWLAVWLFSRLHTDDPQIRGQLQSIATSGPAELRQLALNALVMSDRISKPGANVDKKTRDLIDAALESKDLDNVRATLPLLLYNANSMGGGGFGGGMAAPEQAELLSRPALLPLLFNADESIRQQTRGVLSNISEQESGDAIKYLLDVLNDKSRERDHLEAVRGLAVVAKGGRLHMQELNAVAELQKICKDPKSDDLMFLDALIALDEVHGPVLARNAGVEFDSRKVAKLFAGSSSEELKAIEKRIHDFSIFVPNVEQEAATIFNKAGSNRATSAGGGLF